MFVCFLIYSDESELTFCWSCVYYDELYGTLFRVVDSGALQKAFLSRNISFKLNLYPFLCLCWSVVTHHYNAASTFPWELAFGPYNCNERRERANSFNIMHTLCLGEVHSPTQFASWGLQLYPFRPAWANLVGWTPDWKSFHPPSLTVLQPLCFVEEMPTTSKEYPLAPRTRFCFYFVSELMFQFSVTSSWQDCHLRVAIVKSPTIYASTLSHCPP